MGQARKSGAAGGRVALAGAASPTADPDRREPGVPARRAGAGSATAFGPRRRKAMPDGTAKPVRRRSTADEPSPTSVFLDVPNMPWEDTEFPGIRMRALLDDKPSGTRAMPMRPEPGAVVPLHEHTADERTWVVEGRFPDGEGECGPGRFVRRPAGNTRVARVGPEGATVLGAFLKPHVSAGERPFFSQERGAGRG